MSILHRWKFQGGWDKHIFSLVDKNHSFNHPTNSQELNNKYYGRLKKRMTYMHDEVEPFQVKECRKPTNIKARSKHCKEYMCATSTSPWTRTLLTCRKGSLTPDTSCSGEYPAMIKFFKILTSCGTSCRIPSQSKRYCQISGIQYSILKKCHVVQRTLQYFFTNCNASSLFNCQMHDFPNRDIEFAEISVPSLVNNLIPKSTLMITIQTLLCHSRFWSTLKFRSYLNLNIDFVTVRSKSAFSNIYTFKLKHPSGRQSSMFVCLVHFLMSSSTTRLYRGLAPRQSV